MLRFSDHIDGRTSTFHKHPQQEKYLEWIGDSFDPEAFDADNVNRKLHPEIGQANRPHPPRPLTHGLFCRTTAHHKA